MGGIFPAPFGIRGHFCPKFHYIKRRKVRILHLFLVNES